MSDDNDFAKRRAARDRGIKFQQEIEREMKKEKYQEMPKLAKTFVDAAKRFDKEVNLIIDVIDHDVPVFSPEGTRWLVRRSKNSIKKLEQLIASLQSIQTDQK